MKNEADDDDGTYSFLLNYGANEKEMVDEAQLILHAEKIKIHRTEIARRGLYAFRYLLEIDEKYLLNLLSSTLHHIVADNKINQGSLELANNVSLMIFSVMIIKKGFMRAEAFETIPIELKLLVNSLSKLQANEIPRKQIVENIDNLASSIDTIFLQNLV